MMSELSKQAGLGVYGIVRRGLQGYPTSCGFRSLARCVHTTVRWTNKSCPTKSANDSILPRYVSLTKDDNLGVDA